MNARRLIAIGAYLAARTARLFASRLAFALKLRRLGYFLHPRMDTPAQFRHEMVKLELELELRERT